METSAVSGQDGSGKTVTRSRRCPGAVLARSSASATFMKRFSWSCSAQTAGAQEIPRLK